VQQADAPNGIPVAETETETAAHVPLHVALNQNSLASSSVTPAPLPSTMATADHSPLVSEFFTLQPCFQIASSASFVAPVPNEQVEACMEFAAWFLALSWSDCSYMYPSLECEDVFTIKVEDVVPVGVVKVEETVSVKHEDTDSKPVLLYGHGPSEMDIKQEPGAEKDVDMLQEEKSALKLHSETAPSTRPLTRGSRQGASLMPQTWQAREHTPILIINMGKWNSCVKSTHPDNLCCGGSFTTKADFERHQKSHKGKVPCSICGGSLSRADAIIRHQASNRCPKDKVVRAAGLVPGTAAAEALLYKLSGYTSEQRAERAALSRKAKKRQTRRKF